MRKPVRTTSEDGDTIAPAGELLSAFSYVRVSTKEQAERDGDPEGYSIPAQRAANERKAASIGAYIAAEFVDRGESAKSANRPDLQRMLVAARELHPTYVIVHKVDRLARNRVDDVEINLALRKAGATLVSSTENIDETPSGMLLHGIMSTIAEFYSRNLASEVIKGMNQKALTGGTPTKAPLGYRNVGVLSPEGREVRTVAIDEERGPHITWAFEAYATGHWTLIKLTAELEIRGLTSLATPKRPSKPIRPAHLYRILTNPYYKGTVVWNGAEHPDGRHTPLVTPEIWLQVQETLAAHRMGEKQRDHNHYLKSSVFCGSCGSRLIITNAKNRHGTIYPYFICLGRHQKTTSCTQKAVLISRVEEMVEDEYLTVALPAELRERMEASIMLDLAEGRRQAERDQKELELQRSRLTNERAKLLQAHYVGAVPLDLLKSEQDRIADQLGTVEARLRGTAVRFDEMARNLRGALDLASNCYEAYQRGTDRERRLFNQALFSKILVDDDSVTVSLAEPFGTLLGPGLAGLLATPTAPGEDVPGETDKAGTRARAAQIASDVRKRRGTKKPAPSGAGLNHVQLVRVKRL